MYIQVYYLHAYAVYAVRRPHTRDTRDDNNYSYARFITAAVVVTILL